MKKNIFITIAVAVIAFFSSCSKESAEESTTHEDVKPVVLNQLRATKPIFLFIICRGLWLLRMDKGCGAGIGRWLIGTQTASIRVENVRLHHIIIL